MVKINGSMKPDYETILTQDALRFLEELHRRFDSRRKELLAKRAEREMEIRAGKLPDFLPETESVRKGNWKVGPAPAALDDRRVEITGPVDRKMMINALNSGAKVFMADFEDATSPTWENQVEGQMNCRDAVRRTLSFRNPDGKKYELKDEIATLVVRPRGWHLPEKHLTVDGEPVSGGLFDFGLYFFHNAKASLENGIGPYFYLPKLESHLEARLWNDVFKFSQDHLGIPQGSIRATVLIETILAAFEMDEILYELKEHAAGLNAGRWDYIFSAIKKFRHLPEFRTPDRSRITMTVPFMRAYTELLVKTCHRRGAHAIGGMAAFIPNRRDPEVTRVALQKVREDKRREAGDGFDGTWVAHPDLVPVAMEIFDGAIGTKPNQKDRQREDVQVSASELLSVPRTPGEITESGVRGNIGVAMEYLHQWLKGTGAVALHNLMEDAATAEISRAQLWHWIHHGAKLDNGSTVTADLYKSLRDQELESLSGGRAREYQDVVEILDGLILSDEFTDFLTLPAYERLS